MRLCPPLSTLFTLFFGAVCFLSFSHAASAEPTATIQRWQTEQLEELIEIYREFHRTPELSFQEEQTAKRLADHWRAAGYQVTTGVGGHGVVALMTNGEGPTLMLRTDLDALPVTEETELRYASQKTVTAEDGSQTGVMHACGHDVHMTNLVGVARYLAEHKDQWSGTIMLIGQPAEERGAGARAMLEDGLFERFPKPDFALALHVDASLDAGKVAYRAGYAMANVDSVDITMHGKGGHGAYPQSTIDPVVMAAHLVMDLQTIVSREIKPVEPAVITVGSIHGGTKHNIIGNRCHLQLTVRSYTDEVREHLLSAIQRKAKAVAQGASAPEPTIEISEGTPSLKNDEQLTRRIVEVFREVLGAENALPAEQSLGGEDFSQYGRAGVPIFMFRLGSVEGKRLRRFAELGQSPPSLHSPLYYPDIEPTLATSLKVTLHSVLNLLPVEVEEPSPPESAK
ncbi:MAG: amidohydrolase [Pirellulaceae bacterium]